jgi:hypothetical protein
MTGLPTARRAISGLAFGMVMAVLPSGLRGIFPLQIVTSISPYKTVLGIVELQSVIDLEAASPPPHNTIP